MSIEIGNKSLNIGMYPDNTPVVDLEEVWNANAGRDDIYMTVRPDSLHEFVTAMMVADSFAERGTPIHTLIIPHIPGARQDRLKWEGDWLFTLKSVAKMINERNFKKVMTLDPHSMATTALIDRLVVHTFDLSIILRFRGWDKNYKGVIAPDLGAEKRAEDVAKQFNVPVFHATKQRDPVTNKLSGFKMLDRLIPAAHYLVVDDLCDAGGTFVGLADSIKNVYAVKLDLYVTHGLFTKGTTALEQRFEDIFATDSVTTNNPPVKTLRVVKGMALNA